MPRKPIAVPVRFLGASSLTSAGVDEVTMAKPSPYIMDRSSRSGNWVEKGINIKIMSPITNDNLLEAQKLLIYSEVRHIPVGYLETTIIDNSHIFQFRSSTKDAQSDLTSYFRNSFYSNDEAFVKKTKSMLFDIWKKTRTPSSENI